MTRIEHVTSHTIDDHVAREMYQVDLLHLADGTHVTYRHTPDGLVPTENGLTAALVSALET